MSSNHAPDKRIKIKICSLFDILQGGEPLYETGSILGVCIYAIQKYESY